MSRIAIPAPGPGQPTEEVGQGLRPTPAFLFGRPSHRPPRGPGPPPPRPRVVRQALQPHRRRPAAPGSQRFPDPGRGGHRVPGRQVVEQRPAQERLDLIDGERRQSHHHRDLAVHGPQGLVRKGQRIDEHQPRGPIEQRQQPPGGRLPVVGPGRPGGDGKKGPPDKDQGPAVGGPPVIPASGRPGSAPRGRVAAEMAQDPATGAAARRRRSHLRSRSARVRRSRRSAEMRRADESSSSRWPRASSRAGPPPR